MMWRAGCAALAVALVASGVAVTHVDTPSGSTAASARALPAYDPVAERRNRTTTLDKLDLRLRRAGRAVATYERIGRDMARWFTCVKPLPVDQVGDKGHSWGFEYDERDGTGIDLRPGLVIHRGPGRPDLLMLRFSRKAGCVSEAPDPNGTGADARIAIGHPRAARRDGGHRQRASRLARLEKRMERLSRRIDKVDARFERFDEWESCLSWLPVTESGHEEQRLGYRFDRVKRPAGVPPDHVAAVDIDASEWDDPDYELLVFLGRDRPFGKSECGHEPGEGVDRAAALPADRARRSPTSRADRIADLAGDVKDAREDIEDLLEPVQEFVQFDECMYTVGMRSRGSSQAGYRFVRPDGRLQHRAALSFDMRGLRLPQMDVMAFSGEEPPQIECNEDASGESTDE